MHFAVLLAGISTGLLNFVSLDDTPGVYSAFAFTVCALLAILYSAGMFIYRALSLRKVRINSISFPFLFFAHPDSS
jgi:hypothetical protein